MNRKVILSVTLVLAGIAGIAAPNASATYSRARTQIERVKALAEEINDLLYRRRGARQEDRTKDDPRMYRATQELIDAAKTTAYELASFGEQLAASATGDLERPLKEPARLAKYLVYVLERELPEACVEFSRLLNIEVNRRESDYDSRLDVAGLTVVVRGRAQHGNFLDFVKTCDETVRLLRENLRYAQSMRDDAIKPGAALNQSKQYLEAKLTEHSQELRRAYDVVRDCEARHLDAASRCRDAVAAHDAARQASPSSSYLANHVNAYQRWLAAENVQKDAARASFDAYVQLERVLVDGKSRLVDLARSMKDVERYGEQANPEKIARRWNDLDLWTKLFEYEMNR